MIFETHPDIPHTQRNLRRTQTSRKQGRGMRNNTSLLLSAVGRDRAGVHFFVPFCAAMATGWNISGCWRGAATTASGKSRSAPSTVWWTSTGLTASPWTKWSASETPPRRLSCRCSLDATLIPTPIKTAPRSPSTQPTYTLTMRGGLLHACWILGYDKTPP